MEKRPEKTAAGFGPEERPQQQGEKNAGPQISPADAKHQLQPQGASSQQEDKIGKAGKTGMKRMEEIVPKPQKYPQQTPSAEPLRGDYRVCHPKNRLHPPSRGSS